MIKGKIILGIVASIPLLGVASATTSLSNNKITLKVDASIAGMKIWKMEKHSNGKQLSADSSYYGVIVPMGTNIIEDTIKSLFKDSTSLQVSFETPFQKDKEGIFNIKIKEDQTEIKMKIFVMDKIWTNGVKFINVKLPKEFAIPEAVTSIGDGAFYGAVLNNSFSIPERVKSIGDGAFYGAVLNNSFSIPEGVTSIRHYTFYSTKLNDSFAIPRWATSIGDSAFENTTLNDNFAIPERVTSIGDRAFSSTILNDSFSIPEGVKSIGDGAFVGANFSKLYGQKLEINFSTKVNKNSGLIFKEKQGKAQNAQWVYSSDQLWNDLKLKTTKYQFKYKNIPPSKIIKPKVKITTTDGISINFKKWKADDHKKEVEWVATLEKDGHSLDISGNFNVALKKLLDEKNHATSTITKIIAQKTLAQGATPPTAKQTAFNKVVAKAKQAIQGATSIANVKQLQTKWIPKVITARNALDQAIERANAKHNTDLSNVKTTAIQAIENIKLSTNLVQGATPPTAEQAAFNQAISDAKQAIQDATLIADVKQLQTKWTQKVTAARNALDQAIEKANTEKTAADLTNAKTTANQEIDKITVQKTPIEGVTMPSTEKAAFDNAINEAKKAIQDATLIADVTKAQKEWIPKVITARNALDQAIERANAKKAADDLSNAKTTAIQEIDKITSKKTPIDGVTMPSIEKAAFDNAINEAKKAIQDATSIADVTKAQKEWTTKVITARNALDQAIEKANTEKTAADLTNAKTTANQEIDKITVQKTPIDGVTMPSTEKAAFDNAINEAKKAIQDATLIADVKQLQTKWIPKVITARNALDQAIERANAKKAADDLSNAKTTAIQEIDKITSKKTPIDGVTMPSIEKAAFDNAINEAKKAIQDATSIADVTKAQKEWTTKVITARNALDQAIEKANTEKTAADLTNAKTTANQEIDKITVQKTPIDGVTMPSTEKAAFDNAINEAKKAIQDATLIADVKQLQTKWIPKVITARNALDQAIEKANTEKTAADLTNAKTTANQEIDKITVQKTPIDGVTMPSTEKAAFDNAINEAKKAIQDATSIADVKQLQTKWIPKVITARNALDQAIEKANAKHNTDLSNAKTTAIQAIENIKLSTNLVQGATPPTAEQAAFNQAISDAKQAIQDATSIADVTKAQKEWTTKVITARNALDQAIEKANTEKTAADLTNAKTTANQEIDKITVQKTPIDGVTMPSTEKAAFDNAINEAKKAIQDATLIADVKQLQTKWIPKVITARNALDQAIEKANTEKTAADLTNAKTTANQEIDKITVQKTPIDGVTMPSTEKAAFDNAINEAKKAIQDATSIADVKQLQTKWIPKVITARNALDQAIEKANAKHNTDLSNAKTTAIQAIENIKLSTNLVQGATPPTAEQAAFNQAISDAKQAIQDATSIADVTKAQKEWTTKVITARNALDQAIEKANTEKTAADLTNAKTTANQEIDKITVQKTPIDGVTMPSTEKAAFDNAINEAKKAIQDATLIADVKQLQTKWIPKVITARNALDQAIEKANTEKTAADLTNAKTTANQEIDKITVQKTPIDGVTMPSTEKAAFDNAINEAKKAIQDATLIADVKQLQTKWIPKVITARNALDQAIERANAKHNTDLSNAKTIAIQAINTIDQITAQKTLAQEASPPTAKQNDFAKVVADARTAIQDATSIADVTKAQKEWIPKVITARNALDQAIERANAKHNIDLSNAKTIAIQAINTIDQITAQKTLAQEASPPTAKQNDFAKVVADARTAIQDATSIADVTKAQKEWIPKVITARNALDQAIERANAKHNIDLSNAKTTANQEIDKITVQKTPIEGVTMPSTEKAAFDNAINEAKKAIQDATSIADVTKAQKEWIPKVITARNALDQAIERANAKHNTDLSNVKTTAIQEIDKITSKKTPIDGVTIPSAEKAAFDKAVIESKQAIQDATLIADVTKAQKEWIPKVITARNALDQAIERANAKKAADDLSNAKTTAIQAIKNILIQKQNDANHDVNLFKEIQKAKTDAIKAIKNASTIDVVKALASSATEGSEVLKIKWAINAYNASIGEANVKNTKLKNDQNSKKILNKKHVSKTSIALFTIGSILGLVVLVYIGNIVWKKYKKNTSN